MENYITGTLIAIKNNEPTNIGIVKKPMLDMEVGDCKYFNNHIYMQLDYYNPLHLYILSDDIQLSLKLEDIVYSELYGIGKLKTKIKNNKFKVKFEDVTEEVYYKPGIYNADNVKKVIASTNKTLNVSEIPKWFIDDYCNINDLSCKKVKIETVKYNSFDIGDKVKVKINVYGYNKGDFITVKGFNHKNQNNLISFVEDDEHDMGFNIDNLVHEIIFEIKEPLNFKFLNETKEIIKKQKKILLGYKTNNILTEHQINTLLNKDFYCTYTDSMLIEKNSYFYEKAVKLKILNLFFTPIYKDEKQSIDMGSFNIIVENNKAFYKKLDITNYVKQIKVIYDNILDSVPPKINIHNF
jgi:hypothetical protein